MNRGTIELKLEVAICTGPEKVEVAVKEVARRLPATVRPVVEALVKSVVEARIMVFLSQNGVVVLWLAILAYVEGVKGHTPEPAEGHVVRQVSPVRQRVVAVTAVVDAKGNCDAMRVEVAT
jgi:hypothetical protein